MNEEKKFFEVFCFSNFDLILNEKGEVFEKRSYLLMTPEGPAEAGSVKKLFIDKIQLKIHNPDYSYETVEGEEMFINMEKNLFKMQAQNANIALPDQDIVPAQGNIIEID